VPHLQRDSGISQAFTTSDSKAIPVKYKEYMMRRMAHVSRLAEYLPVTLTSSIIGTSPRGHAGLATWSTLAFLVRAARHFLLLWGFRAQEGSMALSEIL
jgi:hypothetical protein